MKIPEHVLVILSKLVIVQHERLAIVTINEQLERKLYLDVNKTLEALGGKWDRKAKGHVFTGDAQARIDEAIVTGEVTTRADLGHFPTPPRLAAALVEMADVQAGMWTLEPSAGTGRIIEPLLDRGALVVGVEYDAARVAELQEKFSAGAQIEQADFMRWRVGAEPSFERVVMNPPFCKVGAGDHINHVIRAFELLVPGGILIAVMPAGVKFREDRRHTGFRSFVQTWGGRIDDLPEDSFKESKTGVQTCVVRLVHP